MQLYNISFVSVALSTKRVFTQQAELPEQGSSGEHSGTDLSLS